MATRIRRAGLMVALTLLLTTALAGVAWAANVIHCPNSNGYPTCLGTGKNDLMYGTNKADSIAGGHRGADTLYGRGGDDDLIGGVGPDKVYGGPGDDYISNGDSDFPFGRDENHGGRGNDHIVGNLSPEKHFGGRGNDRLVDHNYRARDKNPDVFRCGPGTDEVYYHKGLDKVADDCELLYPAR
jgi:Ca2+-binding RTX toxin-like protein